MFLNIGKAPSIKYLAREGGQKWLLVARRASCQGSALRGGGVCGGLVKNLTNRYTCVATKGAF